MTQEIEKIKQQILPILKEAGVLRSSIFGSVARGEATADSDVDILVDIKKDISLLEFIRLKIMLEEKLGKKVDLVEYGAIKPSLKDKILREHVQLI